MIQTEEQILIVYSVNGTPKQSLEETFNAIRLYQRNKDSVQVIAKPFLFEIPAASFPGSSLGAELAAQLNNSIGAIVFLDDLRPNIIYELGFFHGQNKIVLLTTTKDVDHVWKSISDISGAAMFIHGSESLTTGIHRYLDKLYDNLAFIDVYPAESLPEIRNNIINRLIPVADIDVSTHQSDYGDAIYIDTWGGIIFRPMFALLPKARFKILLRSLTVDSRYSIYFRLRFTNAEGETRSLQFGLTSNRRTMGIEANERNLPSQPLSGKWQLLTGTFQDLFHRGQILGVRTIDCLEVIRVRAGSPKPVKEKNPAWELGYINIIGINE